MKPSTRTRRFLAAGLVSLLIAAPALSLFGLGDAAIVANQVIQIANEVAMIAEAIEQVSNLEGQLNHLTSKHLGGFGQLLDSFQQLSAARTRLMSAADGITDNIDWAEDFTGNERQLANRLLNMGNPNPTMSDYWRQTHAQQDLVSRGRLANLFRNVPNGRASDIWNNSRDKADRHRLFDLAIVDTAERLSTATTDASESLERSRQQTNLSDTALQQELLANTLTAAELEIALAELMKHDVVRDSMERQEAELWRLEVLERWTAAVNPQNNANLRFQNGCRGSRAAYNDALLLN